MGGRTGARLPEAFRSPRRGRGEGPQEAHAAYLYRHLEHRLRTDQDRAYGPELSLVLPGLPRSGSERPRVISGSTPPGRASWEADGTVGDEIRATAV